ncbi:MAG: di-trans,poly-cis-decaprenylcistransferase [Spirochaetaceae bacterium]|nr:di-trans,poly-cis-decaprenylcistransferase [Spirochaetaceae bacterium]
MPEQSETKAVPVHVGIIMDGNGRWAQKRKLPRTAGHKAGVDRAREIMLAAIEAGVKYLTLYTFSTENWKRPESEVSYLMKLLGLHLKTEVDFYRKNGIRLHHLGDITRLSPDLQKDIKNVIEDSKDNTNLNLVLAINYGGHDEVNRAIKKYVSTILAQPLPAVPDTVDLSPYLDLPFLPDADLIIRTGGEKRLSNFLLWQSAYTEFDFCDTLWPDYTKNDFFDAIERFQKIDRRFGGVNK